MKCLICKSEMFEVKENIFNCYKEECFITFWQNSNEYCFSIFKDNYRFSFLYDIELNILSCYFDYEENVQIDQNLVYSRAKEITEEYLLFK